MVESNYDQQDFKYLFDPQVADPKVYIVKMSLKYACNKHEPANEQIARMIIGNQNFLLTKKDMKMNKIEIFYHMNEGDIAPIHAVYKRDLVSGFATISENTEKKNDNPEEQLKHQKIHGKEKECVQMVKSSESINSSEIGFWRVQVEKDIDACKLTNNIDEAMEKVLEVSLHDKARKKYFLYIFF